MRFRDLHGPSPIELRFDEVNVTAADASNAPGAKATVDLAARVNRTGRVRAKGPFGTNPVAATLSVDASRIALMPFRAYIERGLALELAGGTASARGTLDAAFPHDAPARVKWAGNLALEDFGANDAPTGNKLLAWRSLRLEGARANLDPFELSMEGIALDDFYARVIVYADGTLNLAKIARDDEAAPGPAAAQSAMPKSRTRRGGALAGTTSAFGSAAAAAGKTLRRASDGSLPLSLGRIALSNGNVVFSDFFVRPNYSANLTGVTGTVSAMSPAQAGVIDVTAKVDDAAPVEIHGELQPFARDLSFRISGKARDIELPPLSPYSAKYAGYGITRGKMNFDVDYKVENRKLDAKNRLVLDQLTFGDKVDSPDATKLPVLFAVSLLKDANGVIDLDIPISGTLDDPQFSVFAIVVKVIVNLLTRAATAPFALLSSIAGGAGGAAGGEDLALLEFAAGSAAVEGEAAARVERLAKALASRPALKVDVTGRVDAASDADGLARAALEKELREIKFAAVAGTPDEVPSADAIKLAPEERARWVAWLYRNTAIDGRPRDAAGALAEVPAAEMEAMLAKHFAPPAAAVQDLALQRARAAKDALVARGIPAERVFLVAPKAGAAPAKGATAARRFRAALKSRRSGPSAVLGAVVLAPERLGGEVLELGIHRAARRDDAHRLAVLDHRHVPEALFVHHGERGAERHVRAGGVRIRGHHGGDGGRRRIEPRGDDPEHDVALGENADQRFAVDDHHRTDVAAGHHGRCLPDGGVRRRRDDVPAPHHGPDWAVEHGSFAFDVRGLARRVPGRDRTYALGATLPAPGAVAIDRDQSATDPMAATAHPGSRVAVQDDSRSHAEDQRQVDTATGRRNDNGRRRGARCGGRRQPVRRGGGTRRCGCRPRSGRRC